MLSEEYEKAYGGQFSYNLPLIIFTKPRAVSEPVNYNVSEYYFNDELGLGIHKKILWWCSTETPGKTLSSRRCYLNGTCRPFIQDDAVPRRHAVADSQGRRSVAGA